MTLDLDRIDFDKGSGLVTVVAQSARGGDVLMVAFADREALERTMKTGELHLHSRRRGLWKKGETSGNTMRVVDLLADCDADAVLARVEPAGPACHTGSDTCFGPARAEAAGEPDAIRDLERVVAQRAAQDAGASEARPSYTRRLLADRNLRLKKLGEETSELVVALADDDRARVAEEAADVIYHLVVALRAAGMSLDDVREVLRARARGGG